MSEEELNSSSPVKALDILIFCCLQSLGIFAIVGNAALIAVLLMNKYLTRASFILMLSLAIADVMHGFVTTCYFYPPIVLKRVHVPELGVRIFNIIDWTAWAITLTHMAAICIDRLIAIGLYGRYNVIVTLTRVRNYTLTCWIVFFVTNVIFFYTRVCCLIRPLRSQNFYSFGYIEIEQFNSYVLTYTPVEVITIAVLTVSNPITLYQLYKRHKRKVALRQQGTQKSSTFSTTSLLLKQQRTQWQRFQSTITSPSRIVASTMLLEMSMKMGSKHISTDVREIAARRANRQQQRILLQISVVALIFYAYMTVYYVSYYSSHFKSTAAVIFNSFCYSVTHMINPIIYFTLNKEMRSQLKLALNSFFRCICCKRDDIFAINHNSRNRETTKGHTLEQTKVSGTSCSETSPLFSSNNQHKSTCETVECHTEENEEGMENDSNGAESAEIQAIVSAASDESEHYHTAEEFFPSNKMSTKDRSMFLTQLSKALQFSSNKSLKDLSQDRSNPQSFTGRYMKMSSTVQTLAKEKIEPLLGCKKSASMTIIQNHHSRLHDSETSSVVISRSSSSCSTVEESERSEKEALLSDHNNPHMMTDSEEEDDEISYL